MKRIVAFLLCAVICFSLCACGEGSKKGTAIVDLERYAMEGTMPGCDYALWQSADTLLKDFEKESQVEGTEFSYVQREFGDIGTIDTGDYQYCYKIGKEPKVSCIISFGGSFNFPSGAVSIEVKEALTKFEAEEYDTDGEELFFLVGSEFSCIKYEFEQNNILFVFCKNELCATAVYDNALWDF